MPNIQKKKVLNYPVSNIYNLITDVKSFPKISNFIRKVQILEEKENYIISKVHVGLPILEFNYTCKIIFEKNKFVEVTGISGPFSNLYAYWSFNKINNNKTEVIYKLNSKFKNPILESTAGAIFASQFTNAINILEKQLYKRSYKE
jgi:ribosome-associated toxin RatA of RatAB toxin-antitoxin module